MSALTAEALASLRNRSGLGVPPAFGPGVAATAAPPPVTPAAVAPSAASAAPVVPIRLPAGGPRLNVSRNFILDTSRTMGLEYLAEEDRVAVTELLVLVVTVKCSNSDYSSDTYERPGWCRIEPDVDSYLIVVGGWERLQIQHLTTIWHSDPQIGYARNLTDMEVGNVAPNNDPNRLELALVMRWITAPARRRILARKAAESGGTTTTVDDLADAIPDAPSSAHARPKRSMLKRVYDAYTDALFGSD